MIKQHFAKKVVTKDTTLLVPRACRAPVGVRINALTALAHVINVRKAITEIGTATVNTVLDVAQTVVKMTVWFATNVIKGIGAMTVQ